MPGTSHEIQRLKEESEWILSQTSKYYDVIRNENGKKFDKKDVEQLFNDVWEFISQVHEKHHIKVTHKYRVDLLYHVEKKAVEGFTKLHKRYCDVSSPAAHLEQMKTKYHDQWRIQDFPGGGREPSRGGVNTPNFPENCMKSKEFGRPGGRASLTPPPDPPMMISS